MSITRSFGLAASSCVRAATSARLVKAGATHKKALWTAATSSHPDLATAVAQCLSPPSSSSSSSLASPLSSQAKSQLKASVTIVLASRSYPGSDLLTLPSKIPDSISQSSFILGAVVDRVPTESGHGVSTLTLSPDKASLSDSTLDRIVSCQPFFLSSAESRRKRLKEKSVGKWARSQDIEERSLDTADAWASFKSISIGQNQVQVPDSALPPPSSPAHGQEHDVSQDIMILSDLEVHQFLEALDTANPSASKTGLLASSTPFITGKPVTMYYDGKVVQDGVLGVSVVRETIASSSDRSEDARNRRPTLTTLEYPSLAPLGPAMQITKCRGNIILELNDSNATRLLLERLQSTTLTKDKEYFLATGEPTKAKDSQEFNVNMKEAMVYKITGGDPSKGNMAVDTVHDLNVGQWVQFNHHDRSADNGHYDPSLQNGLQGMTRFTTTDPNSTLEQSDKRPVQGDGSVQSIFGGSSENGFIIGQSKGQTWVCTVTDSILKHGPSKKI
ncbi:hypothetical protein BGZ99_005492 [Dissophora globulifera]|uniref:FIST domain-containing protein n=1 Tax=Dissophora globulifera TaxID=979702 RepID=A0A9P6USD2_9FUNG|nr:hypothetical protein BGZ99_005492 [Dissophora globulifera]